MLSSRVHRREALQNVRQRYAGQIGEHEVGLAHTLGRTETHGIHAGNLGRLHADRGVLEDDAFFDTHMQQASGIDEQVWCWLGPHHTVAVGHGVNAGRNLQPLHNLVGVLAG